MRGFVALPALLLAPVFLFSQSEKDLNPRNESLILDSEIHSAQLYLSGAPLTLPIVDLKTGLNSLMLEFDHLGTDLKDYVYTIAHCNSDWQPSELADNEYIDGFTEDRIVEIESSLNTLTQYTHYTLGLPNRNMRWARSGNYVLKVYDNDNERQLVLVRRFLVVEPSWRVDAKFVSPTSVSKLNTHHEIDFSVGHRGVRIPNPQNDIKAYVLQNGRWDNASQWLLQPREPLTAGASCVLQAVPGLDSGDASDPEAAEVQRLAALLPADETQLLYSICLHGRAELGLAPDEYAALTMVLLRLLPFKAPGGAAEKKTLKPAENGATAAGASAAAALQDFEGKTVKAPEFIAQSAIKNIANNLPEQPGAESVAPVPPAVPTREARATETPSAPQAVPAQPIPSQAEAMVSAPLRSLPVRHPEALAPAPQAQPAAPEPAPQVTQGAPRVAPIPVREPRQDSARLQPRPAEPGGAPAARRLVPTEDGEVWYAAVQQLVASEAVTALVRELALQSQLVARDGGHWLLRVERESLNQSGTRERLRAALEAAGLAQDISVELGPVSDSPALRNTARQNARQERALEVVQNDPFVQTLVREFDARIVPGSVLPL